MRDFLLSDHAAQRLAERGIREEWVRLVIQEPSRSDVDLAAPDRESRLRRIAGFENRVLRVVVTRGTPLRVITAFFDRSLFADSDL